MIHEYFPETNPELDSADYKENEARHLHLWERNSLNYPTVDTYLQWYDPLYDHVLRDSPEKRDNFAKVLEELNGLERHFRLAQNYLERDRHIAANFHPDWVRNGFD